MIQAKQRQLISIALQRLKRDIKTFSRWYIFPFQINSGAIGNSETGYKPLNAKVTDYGNYELIFTGDSPVIVIWQGSTRIYQKNKGIKNEETGKVTEQDQFYTKEYNLEKAQKWQSYLIEDISNVNFNNLNSNTLFNTLSIGRTYTLISFDEQIKVNDYLQFFVVLNDNDTNIAGGTINEQDRQLLYLSNVTNKYDPYTNKFYCQIITLSSVNDKASTSGLTLQSFIQYGGAGSGYAFPEFNNKKLQFNQNLMRDIGVRYAHRQFYGLEALSSISYFGRPIIQGQKPIQIDNKEIYEQKIFASRRLFIAGTNEFNTNDEENQNGKSNGGLYAGINDLITTNSHPETTFYNIMDAKPTGFKNYSDWQEFLASQQFNMLAEKSFKGILAFDATKAKNSNGTDIGQSKFFWDSEWNISNLTGSYNIEMSTNFRYKDPDKEIVVGSSTVDYAKIPQKWMSSILNFNSVIFSSLLQMPYDSTQWIPFALSQIPLIGKMLNALLLGIPVGFIITQNSQQYKKMLYFNAFMSAFYTDALDGIFGKTGLIPLNLFSTQNNMELGKMLGAKVSTTALLMKLTDRISLFPWNEEGEKLTIKEQISTIDLSQKKDNKIYIMDEETEFLDINSTLTNKDNNTQWNPTPDGTAPGENYAYIIDYLVTQSLGQGEERHTFYSDNPFTYQGDYNEISVAQYKIRNQASFTDNLFNWTTQYKLNHDEYNETEETSFDYPAAILPPDPLNIAKPITIVPTSNIYNAIFKDNNVLFTIDWNNRNISYTPQFWMLNNGSKIKQLQIPLNLKDYLDPSLLINTFNDLKRFYKSISIYLKWEYKTKEEWMNKSGFDQYVHPSENFSNKKQEIIREYELDKLQIYNDNKNFIDKKSNEYIEGLPEAGLRFWTGLATIGKEINDTKNLYNLLNASVLIKRDRLNARQPVLTISDKSEMFLGFKSNNNSLNFTIELFPLYFLANFLNVQFNSGFNGYVSQYVEEFTIEISRIILNPK